MLAIERSEVQARQDAARKAALAEGLAGLLVVGRSFYDRPGDLAYLCHHFPAFPATEFLEQAQGLGHSALVLPVEGPGVLVTDSPDVRREWIVADRIEATSHLAAGIARALAATGMDSGRVGLVGSDVAPYRMMLELSQQVANVQWVAADKLVRRMRQIKSPAEIEALRAAAAVCLKGLEAARDAVQPGATEHQVAAAGIAACMEAGADFVRYLRVHSGPWGGWSQRWPQATDRVLQEGELVCLDLVGAYRGYQFDLLWTVPVGDPGSQERELLAVARSALEAAVEQVRPGVTVGSVVQAARDVVEKAGYGQHFTPFCGHAIGLETVEAPLLVPDSQHVLEEGMVLCLEPGILIPGVRGARFEDTVVVRSHGVERLAVPPYPA